MTSQFNPLSRTLIIGLVIFLCSGCTKNNLDRRSHICFTTQHHDLIIPNITIYVKYGATEYPGYEPLDQFHKVLTSDENGRVCMQDIPLGSHWFMAIGYDELIREQVIGNIPLRFDLNHLQIDTVLYVGEE